MSRTTRVDAVTPDLADERVPYRLVSRLSNELHLSAVVSLRRLGCRTYDRAVVFIALLRLCLPDWARDGGLAAPAALSRFGTVKGLARSLDHPAQTVRRHARALVEEGFLRQERQGYAIDPAPKNAARVVAYCLEAHDILIRMIEDLPPDMRPKPLRARSCPPSTARVVEVALDTYLFPFEALHDKLGDWTSMLVWGMIGTANTRHIMLDPALNLRYAVEPTPDRLRRPVSLQALSGAIGLPYATVWRHADRLHAAGLLARRPEGWLLTGRELHRPEVEASVRELCHYYLRRIGALVAEGLDTADLSGRYAVGRPALVPIGAPPDRNEGRRAAPLLETAS